MLLEVISSRSTSKLTGVVVYEAKVQRKQEQNHLGDLEFFEVADFGRLSIVRFWSLIFYVFLPLFLLIVVTYILDLTLCNIYNMFCTMYYICYYYIVTILLMLFVSLLSKSIVF